MEEAVKNVHEDVGLTGEDPFLVSLLPALKRLDALLERAISSVQTFNEPDAATDLYRGLYISREEVEHLLAREPGAPTFQPDGKEAEEPLPDPIASETSRLAWLQRAFGLSLFDLDLVILALAPELDRRYERLYAYLQDHVSYRQPSVDLALNLLCPDAATRLERRVHFAADAPLIRHGLIHLVPRPDQAHPSLLAYELKLDDQIVNLILGQDHLDARLAPFCQIAEPMLYLEDLPLSTRVKETLPPLVIQAWEAGRPLRLYFHGPVGVGKRSAAEALAGEVGVQLLIADLARVLAAPTDFAQFLKLLFREAWFRDSLLYLDGLDALRHDGLTIQYQGLLEKLAEDAGLTILAGTQPWAPSGRDTLGVVTVPFFIPGFSQRRDCWQAELDTAGIELDEHDLDIFAGRFRLTPHQITEAVAVAINNHQLARNDPQSQNLPISQSLFAAARAQTGHDLATLARKIEPLYIWDDIVLPDDTIQQLHEICQRVDHRHRVLSEWGFDHKLSQGKGVTTLFAGPSGTGKTMAAEIIANELSLDLYKIDLSSVVSKYIGETEKNLDRIFTAAENANTILFFDEADALFGKRSEVRDSHDRYANIEISYLLQKMEEYDGLAILATNLRQNLDESFIRRLAFSVHFPFPDEASRGRIWAGIWPNETPRTETLDLDFLARQFKLSGGNIKNIALAAAFLAADDGGRVSMSHLNHATRREYQKMGKVLSEAEMDSTREKTADV